MERKYFAEEDAKALLRNWIRLNNELMTLPIEAVRELLEYAVSFRRGSQLVLRLYMRYNRLRRMVEVHGLRKGVLPWNVGNRQSSTLKRSA